MDFFDCSTILVGLLPDSELEVRVRNSVAKSTRVNWRFLLGEFFVVVLGVLVALWVDEVKEARVEARLEAEYLQSFLIDLEADLVQFDSADAWSRRQETAAATVISLYDGTPTTKSDAELVAAVETAGWQFFPSITRNTIDDLKSTGNLRLIRDPALRRAITTYYATLENSLIPIADMRDRMWRQYDANVANVLRPQVRLGVLQGPGSFGQGVTSDAFTAAPPPGRAELVSALRAYPPLRVAASEVLYGSRRIESQLQATRASVAPMRRAALELRGVLERELESR